MSIRDTETQPASVNQDVSSPVELLVYGTDGVHCIAVPGAGALTIGRDLGVDIRIEDPQVSRLHAVLHVGPPITIEDRGSANGTWLRGVRLDPGRPAPLGVDAPVQIGGHIVVLRRESSGPKQQRVHRGLVFRQRLEDECARAERSAAALTVAGFQVEPPAHGERALDILIKAIRAYDVLGAEGAGDFKVIMPGAAADDGAARARQIVEAMREAGVAARTSVASFPRDGHGATALLAALSSPAPTGAVVESEGLRAVCQQIDRAAESEVSVLLLGETGVGKDVLAQRLHARSPRAAGPFVRFNCAAFTETLLESELFGHEKGAFTGAVAVKPGLLETADGGTVFLDEVGEMPMTIQAKLLHAVEARTVMRVGGLRERAIDVRFVSATNRDLAGEIKSGGFRADLYFRLAGFAVEIPPLRARTADILPLAMRFLAAAYDARRWITAGSFAPAAAQALLSYAWPGNIRELRNAVEWAAMLSPDGRIEVGHLPMSQPGRVAAAAPVTEPDLADLSVEQAAERQRILDALAACAGNQSRAARMLGIARSTLLQRLDRYGIARPRVRHD